MHYVIVPGIGGSDAEHWQTRWQDAWGGTASRIAPASWHEPELDDWCLALDRAVADSGSSDVVLIAHSLGCLAAAAWLADGRRHLKVAGAFLVAPPDAAAPAFPAEAGGFGDHATAPLPVPSLVISSDDDPYCDPEAARKLAGSWMAGHLSIGRAGHINSASGVGVWPGGRALLTAFTSGLSALQDPEDR